MEENIIPNGTLVRIHSPHRGSVHRCTGVVSEFSSESFFGATYSVLMPWDDKPYFFNPHELQVVDLDKPKEVREDKDMEKELILAGTRVRVNCPDATAIHGKLGSIKSYNPTSKTYQVSMDIFNGQTSYLAPNELEVVEENVQTGLDEFVSHYNKLSPTEKRLIKALFLGEGLDEAFKELEGK